MQKPVPETGGVNGRYCKMLHVEKNNNFFQRIFFFAFLRESKSIKFTTQENSELDYVGFKYLQLNIFNDIIYPSNVTVNNVGIFNAFNQTFCHFIFALSFMFLFLHFDIYFTAIKYISKRTNMYTGNSV